MVTGYFDDADRRSLLIAECDSWLGTPWVACGHTAGPHRARKGIGADCTHWVAAAYEATGALTALQLPAYVAHPGMAEESASPLSLAKFLDGLVQAGRVAHVWKRVDGWGVFEPVTGDLLSFRFAGRDHHVGIYKGGRNGMFWHAAGQDRGGKIMLSSIRESTFRVALTNLYRPLGAS